MSGPKTKSQSTKSKQLTEAGVSSTPPQLSKRKGVVTAIEKASKADADAGKANKATAGDVGMPMNKPQRPKSVKVVRDDFSMPKSDHEKIAALKRKCADNGIAVKKSELLRAGLLILAGATDEQLVEAVRAVGELKKGGLAKA